MQTRYRDFAIFSWILAALSIAALFLEVAVANVLFKTDILHGLWLAATAGIAGALGISVILLAISLLLSATAGELDK